MPTGAESRDWAVMLVLGAGPRRRNLAAAADSTNVQSALAFQGDLHQCWRLLDGSINNETIIERNKLIPSESIGTCCASFGIKTALIRPYLWWLTEFDLILIYTSTSS